ncbi:hypothetical protein LCGC14_0817190 [marine sediment metagenome]|uniref:Uncharacterized protein n=1 Tax=marine sediment metagenome TaxID=412755 RepID=A0A0F9SSC9_9ZZZZ
MKKIAMNLYRVNFKIYREAYYVVASDARNAFHRAQIVIARNRSDYAERTHMDRIEVETLCDVDDLILGALDDEEEKPENPDKVVDAGVR